MAAELTIRSVRARPLDLPLAKPIETAGGTVMTAPLVLVDVRTTEGITGRSYASVYSKLALVPLARLVEDVAELLVGGSGEPALVRGALTRHFKLLGLQGLTGIAVATLDMALWDARAKAAGTPLAALLGGDIGPVAAYASLASATPEAAAEDARRALELGFTAFKVKIGHSDLPTDLAAVRAVRDVIGPDAELMVDYNQALSVADAIGRANALEDENVTWIEEPTRADDYAGHAAIAAATTIPLQLGENWWGVHDMEKSVAAHASHHVMFDAMKIGGVSGWLEAAELAAVERLPVSSHVFPEVSAHLLAATPTAHRLEYVDKVGPILEQPVRVDAGSVVVADSPGVGIEWDEQAIRSALRDERRRRCSGH